MKMVRSASGTLSVAALLVLVAWATPAARQPDTAMRPLGREILKELIETNTTLSSGNTTQASERMAARLIAAGFPRADVVVVGGPDHRKNLVARLRGRAGGGRPVLFFAHLDVVEARREDWSMDPFVLTERDGWFYGRGTLDVKGGAATLVTAFCSLRQRGVVPARDLILALTADEEGGPDNGIQWLLANRRDLIDAAYAINLDSGGPEIRGGRVSALTVQAAEKVFASFTLTVRNPGGHSSLPVARTRSTGSPPGCSAWRRWCCRRAPARSRAPTSRGRPSWRPARTRPTCAPSPCCRPTRPRRDGSAHNRRSSTRCCARPACRRCSTAAMPRTRCRRPRAPPSTAGCCRTRSRPTSCRRWCVPSPTRRSRWRRSGRRRARRRRRAEVLSAIEGAAQATWGRVPIVPLMETGATDGLFLRNAGMPVYGVTGIAYDTEDVRAHGKDERILVRSFDEGIAFMERLVEALGRSTIAPSGAR